MLHNNSLVQRLRGNKHHGTLAAKLSYMFGKRTNSLKETEFNFTLDFKTRAQTQT